MPLRYVVVNIINIGIVLQSLELKSLFVVSLISCILMVFSLKTVGGSRAGIHNSDFKAGQKNVVEIFVAQIG